MPHSPEHATCTKSILERKEIHAPDGFVSVFHETKAEALSAIDLTGLQTASGDKNIGAAGEVAGRNALIDSDRPDAIVTLGLSRESNIYAYPFLAEGHGLYGADQRFVVRRHEKLKSDYELLKQYGSEILRTMGVETIDEYTDKMRDPEYLKQQHPGEVLELKVDPTRCFVGDLVQVTNIFDGIKRWGFEKGDATRYWEDLITLEDFLKWYRKPEWEADGNSVKLAGQFRDGDNASPGNYCPVVGAPAQYPWSIMQPEILIPDSVPQEHIRVVH